jgi:hypothetical protein
MKTIRRADDLRRRVDGACGHLLVHDAREHSDPAALVRAAGPPPPPEADPPPEVQEAIREMLRQHHESWVDEPVPALGGMTPRQAAATSTRRHDPELLPKDIEHHPSRSPAWQRQDLSWLRRELGLTT